MANIDEEPKYACSASVQEMRDEMGDALVTSSDIVAYLLDMHPEYADGLAENVRLVRDGSAPRRSVDEWLNDVSELYEDEERPLDGRLVILGLAIMIRNLQRGLRQDDFLLILMYEYEPDYESLLSPGGKELFNKLYGQPRMEDRDDGAKGFGFDSPADHDLTGDEQAAFEDIFEAMPPMAVPMEPAEVAPAVEPDEEEVFEAIAESEATTPQETPLRQVRRLEAAMPESVQVQRGTEVWVMFPRAGSEGLRALLPAETVDGQIIEKDNVEESGAAIVFPDRDQPIIVYISVEASSKDFEIEKPVKKVKVRADSDGIQYIFNLMPLRPNDRASVQVVLYSDEELTDPISVVPLFTKIEPPKVGDESGPLAELTSRLSYATVPVSITITGDVYEIGDMTNVTGVAIGRDANAMVNGGALAAGITELFTPLLTIVSGNAPQDKVDFVITQVQALQVEIEKGPQASDPQIAIHIQVVAELVPVSTTAILELFRRPEINMFAGNLTRSVIEQLER